MQLVNGVNQLLGQLCGKRVQGFSGDAPLWALRGRAVKPAALLAHKQTRPDHGHSDKLFQCRLPLRLADGAKPPVWSPAPKQREQGFKINTPVLWWRSFSYRCRLTLCRQRIKVHATVASVGISYRRIQRGCAAPVLRRHDP